jgi:hypothetical protein
MVQGGVEHDRKGHYRDPGEGQGGQRTADSALVDHNHVVGIMTKPFSSLQSLVSRLQIDLHAGLV